ncbi:MAG: hypothetical protein GFH27_549283n391 [Chloroflexi bacterium AL-W]|nr:hypothetical protein [Chloroflexi bacterium AL-N1]NOK64487.1 hypothetical protein [Chloroflexi bacterium AL-N10]NOK75729.1 hypothetical protein [Chloroflexi bacterium AL-N5]NOK80512.1 hypothetical protein [Chloroflexi bacterium AL-W]NOK87026.1 hypothetical protein [Chloroflexi bacterium AL-N15]
MEEKYFTINEVSDMFKVTRKAVYDWMEKGWLEYVIVGTHRRITQSAIDAFVQRGSAKSEEKKEEDQKNETPERLVLSTVV